MKRTLISVLALVTGNILIPFQRMTMFKEQHYVEHTCIVIFRSTATCIRENTVIWHHEVCVVTLVSQGQTIRAQVKFVYKNEPTFREKVQSRTVLWCYLHHT